MKVPWLPVDTTRLWSHPMDKGAKHKAISNDALHRQGLTPKLC